MQYDSLLFDLDGTLTDPREGITRSVQHALAQLGIHEPDLAADAAETLPLGEGEQLGEPAGVGGLVVVEEGDPFAEGLGDAAVAGAADAGALLEDA